MSVRQHFLRPAISVRVSEKSRKAEECNSLLSQEVPLQNLYRNAVSCCRRTRGSNIFCSSVSYFRATSWKLQEGTPKDR